MEAATAWAETRDESTEAVAHAAVADKAHHFGVLVALGAPEALPEMGPRQITHAGGLVDAGLGRRGATVSFSCQQGIAL